MLGSTSWPSYCMGIKPVTASPVSQAHPCWAAVADRDWETAETCPASSVPLTSCTHLRVTGEDVEQAELFWVTSTELRDGDWREKNQQSHGNWQFFSLLLEPDHCIFQLLYPAWCCLHIALGTFPSLSFIQPNVCQKNYQWELMLFPFYTWNEWLITSDIVYLRLGNPAKVPNSLLSIHFFHIIFVFQIACQSKNMTAWWLSSFIPILELCKNLHWTLQFCSISHGFVIIQEKQLLSQWGGTLEEQEQAD